MAYSDILDLERFSFGYAPQADLVTTGSSWTWLDVEAPTITELQSASEVQRAARSRGDGMRRQVGRTWYRLAFRGPIYGQAAAYAYASDSPELTGILGLLSRALGNQSAVTYGASTITNATGDGNTVVSSTDPASLGCLLAYSNAAVVEGMGYMKSVSGAGPYNLTMFEDVGARPGGTGRHRLPTYTACPGSSQPDAVTFRLCGEDTSQDHRFLGGMLESATLTHSDEDNTWYCEVSFVCYAGYVEASSGGLQTLTSLLALGPYTQENLARWVLGSNIGEGAFAALNDGTADPDGSCGLREVSLSMTWAHRIKRCPSAPEGVGEVLLGSPRTELSVAVPRTADLFNTAGDNALEAAYDAQTAVSFSAYMGAAPGRIFAINQPAGVPKARPSGWVNIEGVAHQRVVLEAGHYDGDGATTAAGNTTVRFSVG